MIEKVRKILDEDGKFDALLKYLLKAFHCLAHDLLEGKIPCTNL